jgi:hypothetical protein
MTEGWHEEKSKQKGQWVASAAKKAAQEFADASQ